MIRKFCALAVFLILSSDAYGSEIAKTFFDGIQAYKENNFDKAITAFEKISGVKNPKLFYNLGNAYLKNNDLGHSMLWYERALKLNPDDPDLKFNYNYALSLTKDEKDDREFPIIRILFFWKYLLSSYAVQCAALSLNLLFWLVLIIRMLMKKKLMKTFGYVLLMLTLIFTLTAFYNEYEEIYLRQAIILPEKISVRSGFAQDSTELFALHAGTKVRIEKESKDFFRIYFSEGKIGWIRKSEAGVI
jgi:tetratricopeptide (TPR) repeat protein